MSQMYELSFTDQHHVKITYVPGYTVFGPMAMRADEVARLTKLHSYIATYDTVANNKIRLAFGSNADYFHADIQDNKLFLTPSEPPTGDAKADAEIAAAEPTMVFVRTAPH
jgi:hypothetical protein